MAIKRTPIMKLEKRKPNYLWVGWLLLGVLASWIVTYGYLKTQMWLAAEYIADGRPATAYHILGG